jgi:hypothetical protein
LNFIEFHRSFCFTFLFSLFFFLTQVVAIQVKNVQQQGLLPPLLVATQKKLILLHQSQAVKKALAKPRRRSWPSASFSCNNAVQTANVVCTVIALCEQLRDEVKCCQARRCSAEGLCSHWPKDHTILS